MQSISYSADGAYAGAVAASTDDALPASPGNKADGPDAQRRSTLSWVVALSVSRPDGLDSKNERASSKALRPLCSPARALARPSKSANAASRDAAGGKLANPHESSGTANAGPFKISAGASAGETTALVIAFLANSLILGCQDRRARSASSKVGAASPAHFSRETPSI